VDYGAIMPADPDAGQWVFHADCIVAARTACRLRNDFEVNVHGIPPRSRA